MFTVALIGLDGAGKSTIARMLAESFTVPVKVMYMGVNLDSSNVTLPTSRLIRRLKQAQRKKAGITTAAQRTLPGSQKRSGKLRAALRLVNRLSEEWYRQMLIWRYEREGSIVVCDRHFQFDFEYDVSGPSSRKELGFTEWFHRWYLARLYPRPDMVIFLDAPAEVLYGRKGEATVEWLDARRQALTRQGETTPNFIRIDATKPLDTVYAEVSEHILDFYQLRQPAHGLLGQVA